VGAGEPLTPATSKVYAIDELVTVPTVGTVGAVLIGMPVVLGVCNVNTPLRSDPATFVATEEK